MKPTRTIAFLAFPLALLVASCNGDDPVAPAATIAVNPATVTFTGTQGQPAPDAQNVAITNTGGGTLAGLTATTTYGQGQPTGWLNLNLSSTTAPATLTLTPDIAGLAAGNYSATVSVASPNATNSPRTINVTLTVGEAGGVEHTFEYTPPVGAPAITTIHVPGDHNDWSETGTPMQQTGGVWRATVNLPPGTNNYKFRINGNWIGNMCNDVTWGHPAQGFQVDLNADGCVDDGFGGMNAYVEIDEP